MPHAITSFAEAHELLMSFAPRNISRPAYTLEHMERLMRFLGDPQNKLKVIHVAGTSGKTSTCYYLASLIKESGKKVGLSVSPHVYEVNERVQIDLVPMPQQQFCDEFAHFMDLVAQSDLMPTYFELLTAFAFWEFVRNRVEYAVIETGVGGALDATNVVGRADKVCVITDIGLDHQHLLGGTLAEIAEQKAGIIQLHNKVYCYAQEDAVMAPIRARARQKQADLHTLTQTGVPKTFSFLPLFQQRNFGLARRVVREVLARDGVKRLNDAAEHRAAHIWVPARMEILRVEDKTIILDGAHNAQKFAALKASLQWQYPEQPIAALAAFKASSPERLEASAKQLTAIAHHIIATSYGDPASADPHAEDPAVVTAMCKIHGFWDIETMEDPAHAWRLLLERPEPVLLVTGSMYLFGTIRPLVGAGEG